MSGNALKEFLSTSSGGYTSLRVGHYDAGGALRHSVVGVVPYYRDIYIEEEDSVALAAKSVRAEKGKVNIAVILLRHLSNFTDFNVLERDPRVHLFYTNNVDELAKADVILLPYSKSTLDDLYELRRNGVAAAITRAHREGLP